MAYAANLLQEGAREVKFLRLLGEVADGQVLAPEHGSRLRRVASNQDLEERRLAGAVRADEAELVPFRELEVDVREQEASAVGLRDALEAHDPRTRGAFAEGEAEGPRGGRWRLRHLAPHLLDPQLAGEHLLVHLAGLELLDDRELTLHFFLVSVALCFPGPRDRVALHPVVGVIADVLEGAQTVQFYHLLRDRVEEELVVACQEDGRVDLQEELLDRLDRVDVHMVRRFVEQEDVLLLRVREGARGEDLGLLAAGEGAEPLVEELLTDAEVIEDRVVDDHALPACGPPGRRAGIRSGPWARSRP